MKKDQKGIGKIGWEQMEVASRNPVIGFSIKKLTGTLAVVVCITYFIYSLNLLFLNNYGCGSCLNCKINCTKSVFAKHFSNASGKSVSLSQNLTTTMETLQPKINVTKTGFKTDLQHIVFGIAASSKLWERRRDYIRLWWNPREMRGFVWLDEKLKNNDSNGKNGSFPPIQISENTSHFKYTNKEGHRSALRISRIVSETFRLGLPDVHWFVMGDDDTVFVAENLVRVLSKYDHRQMYYIGSLSESHLQNLHFSYNMAYGGGGFAISYPLARALEKVQDSCMQRYPGLYGSDDRVQACMAELGVPLTREPGFHQYDIYGNLFGLLAAHPVTPLVTLHHLDVVEPIFPNKTRIQALQHLFKAVRLDSAGILQQSICYDSERQWSISVSWGYAVQIFRGIFPPRDLETPSRTFLNWYKRADYTAYSFNTRPVTRHPCQKPFVFFLKDIHCDRHQEVLISKYTSHEVQPTVCRWKMASPESVKWIQVTKKPQTYSVTQAPRRNCCRIVSSNKTSVHAEVGPCKQGEIIGL